MSNVKEIKIGSTDYIIEKMFPLDRSEVLFEINQIFNGGVEKYEGFNVQNLSKVVAGIIDRMPPRESAALMKRIICLSVAGMNQDDNYNIHFQEFYEDQFLLIPEILAFNTGGIIPMLKKKFPIIEKFFQTFLSVKKELTEELEE